MNIPVRRIRIENLYNFRDLGGFETNMGQTIVWNKLFRSDSLVALKEEQWEKFRELGIKTIIDLRSKSETITYPDQVPEGIEYFHCPMQKEEIDLEDVEGSTERAFSKSMNEGYCLMLDNGPHLIANAVNTVINGLEKGGVLFHCTAGKDRTGTLAAILYTLLGAAREDIIADYQVSHTYNEPGLNKLVKEMGKYEEMKYAMLSEPDYIEPFLDKLEIFDLEQMLLENGVTVQEIMELRNVMLV